MESGLLAKKLATSTELKIKGKEENPQIPGGRMPHDLSKPSGPQDTQPKSNACALTYCRRSNHYDATRRRHKELPDDE